jgi:hypothetical protein
MEKVRVEFIDMTTYLATSGSKEDLSEDEINAWQ